jgi:hypothetical protein
MKWVVWIVVSLIAVVGIIGLIGLFLPVSHEASRSAAVSKPPEVVFALLSDLNSYPSWWDGATVQ